MQILQKAAAFYRVLGRTVPESGLNMFQYDEQCWTKGGQQLQEFWNSAELHLKVRQHQTTQVAHADALKVTQGDLGCAIATGMMYELVVCHLQWASMGTCWVCSSVGDRLHQDWHATCCTKLYVYSLEHTGLHAIQPVGHALLCCTV